MPANQSLEQPVTLLPCPFCNANLVQRRPPHGSWWHGIEDYKCIAQGVVVDEETAAQWNTRTTPPSDEQEVERVAVQIEPATAQTLMDWNVLHFTDAGWTIDLNIWRSAMQDSGAIRALTKLRDEIVATEEHGDGADDESCPICNAVAEAGRALLSIQEGGR